MTELGQFYPHLVVVVFSLFAIVLAGASAYDNLRGPAQ